MQLLLLTEQVLLSYLGQLPLKMEVAGIHETPLPSSVAVAAEVAGLCGMIPFRLFLV